MADPFNTLSCYTDYDNHKIIHWTLNPEFEPTVPIDFYVWRARSASPDWENIAGPLTDQCFYKDRAKLIWNKSNDVFYQVRFTFNGKEFISEPFNMASKFASRHDWLIYRDLLRKTYLEMKRYGGIEGRYLRHKQRGTPCPQCTDWDTKEVVRHDCPICLGTGIVGGYYPGITMWVKYTSHVVNDKKTEPSGKLGVIKDREVSVLTPAYPWIESFDIWVDGRSNNRYLIDKIQTAAEFSGFPYMYSMRLELIADTDILYSDEANETVKNVSGNQKTDNNWRPNLDIEY